MGHAKGKHMPSDGLGCVSAGGEAVTLFMFGFMLCELP
jgi:hypothetical protein